MKNYIHSVIIKNGEEVIGMGRIIGDDGCFCQVVDIYVLPAYQAKGKGKMIIGNLADHIRSKLPKSCYGSLIADGDAACLDEKFGLRILPQIQGDVFESLKHKQQFLHIISNNPSNCLLPLIYFIRKKQRRKMAE